MASAALRASRWQMSGLCKKHSGAEGGVIGLALGDGPAAGHACVDV